MSKPRVLLADDHQILAEGLRGLLEPEFEVVDVVADGRELVAAARKHRPDVTPQTQRQMRLSHADFTRLGELLLLQPHR